MPTGHQTFGWSRARPGSVFGENDTVCAWPGARRIVRRSGTPATSPVIVASCAAASRLRASTCTVSVARARSGSDSVGVTRGKRSSTGPVRTMSTPRHGPMLLSGGVGFQSTQPIDRLLRGSPGCTRSASTLLPACTQRVTSSSCTG